MNALLSFAYAMLAKDCFSVACVVGFDPYKGFFHAGRHGKPSLALDLIEEFRPVIADSVVLTLINNEMLTPDDFIIWRDACHLTDTGRRAFFAAYEQRKATAVTHPVYGYRMSYARVAANTGLRLSELASLAPGHFHLTADPPVVRPAPRT